MPAAIKAMLYTNAVAVIVCTMPIVSNRSVLDDRLKTRSTSFDYHPVGESMFHFEVSV